MPFPTRDSQTRIKHGILREYAGAWAGIIATGVRGVAHHAEQRGQHFQLDLVYVDGFGGPGRYGRDSDQPVSGDPIWGSPIIGVRAIETSGARFTFPIQISGIVVEEDEEYFHELVRNVHEAGLSTPIAVRSSIREAMPGQVSLINGDFRDHVPDLVRWLRDRFALVLIDPFGTGMPMSALTPLLARPKTDAIVLFPFHDIDRKSGSVKKPERERTPHDRGNITRITNVFGSDAWVPIARDGDLSASEREERYAALYFAALQQIDSDLVVKNIALRLSAMDRTGYHLFLTTRDADGAMRMNDILRSAEFEEHFAVWRDQVERMRQREEASAQESLFGGLGLEIGGPPPAVEAVEIETEVVEQEILALCPHGRDLGLKDVYRVLANTPFRTTEIARALRSLRKKDLAHFDNLSRKDDRVRIGG